MNLREAAQQALEALEVWRDCLTNPDAQLGWRFSVVGEKAITALRAALAEDRSADAGKTSDHFADANKMVATSQEYRTVFHQEMDCYGDGNVYRGQRSSDSQAPTLTINGLAKKTSVRGTFLEANVRNAFDRIYSDHIPDATKMEETSQESRQVEPVAWMVYTLDGQSAFVTDNPADFTPEHRALPLYTAPPTREPLTVHQLNAIELRQRVYYDNDSYDLSLHDFARAIERAHGIGGEE